MAPYDGSGGLVHYTFKGGTPKVVDDPYITVFGQGSETDIAASTDANNIGGVTELGTGGSNNDSVGIAFPNGFRPGILEDGRIRDAGGTGIFKVRLGFPSITNNLQLFFGIIEGHPGANYDVDDILTAVAGGTLTFVEDNFAGFWYDGRLTTDAEFWRTIAGNAGGGVKDAANAKVKTGKAVKAATTYMSVDEELSPVLSLEVTPDGTVEWYWNGERVQKIEDAVKYDTSYSPILVMQTESANAVKVGIDWMDACWQSYLGPVIP